MNHASPFKFLYKIHIIFLKQGAKVGKNNRDIDNFPKMLVVSK
jgi:hypothetical protein